jgi:hypothetical protein
MPNTFQISDIQLLPYRVPSITAYNRLEASPRTADFDRSLSAEIRDPLWMLTRQWQFGEFNGEDAASAVTTKILAEHTPMNTINFTGNSFPYDVSIPLETIAERETLKANLSLAVQMGRYFMKLIKTNPAFTAQFGSLLKNYPLNYTPDNNDYEGQQLLDAVKGKIFDGYNLYNDIINGKVAAELANSFAQEIEMFKSWYARNYSQPVSNSSAWQPSLLEYQFKISSGSETPVKTLVADHYYEGHLDWYSFDLEGTNKIASGGPPVSNATEENLVSYIPSPVTFKGMPNPRYWMMEEGKTDFGKIDASATGLLHLLLAEFGLTCSTDWFVLPYQLSINTVCEIKGIVVTDVFGQHILIRPAGNSNESQWQRWAMFHNSVINNNSTANTSQFYLPPALSKLVQGPPLEEVNFLRDEMTNMVWAVESTVPSQAGKGLNGDEMAIKPQEKTSNGSATANSPGVATVQYVLGSTVPDNWIPFIPVHMEGSDTEIRLQRATLPGSKGALGVILKEKQAPYYVDEEIVQRSGIIVKRSFQRARWLNGKTYLWIGREKTAGRGEGISNLKFDQIEDV